MVYLVREVIVAFYCGHLKPFWSFGSEDILCERLYYEEFNVVKCFFWCFNMFLDQVDASYEAVDVRLPSLELFWRFEWWLLWEFPSFSARERPRLLSSVQMVWTIRAYLPLGCWLESGSSDDDWLESACRQEEFWLA